MILNALFSANVNSIATMIEPFIYEGRADEVICKKMWQAGRSHGSRKVSPSGVEESVQASVSSAGARLTRETQQKRQSLLVELDRLETRTEVIEQGTPELKEELRTLEEKEREVASKIEERLLEALEAAPDVPDDEEAPVAAPDYSGTALERLMRKRAQAEEAAEWARKRQKLAEIRALKEQQAQQVIDLLREEQKDLESRVNDLRARLTVESEELAAARVRIREVRTSLGDLSNDVRSRWDEMVRVGELLWARFADGYQTSYKRPKAEEKSSAPVVEPAIAFPIPEAMSDLLALLESRGASA